MQTTLRPLTLGEILDRTAELYRTHFLLLAGISSVYAGVLLVIGLAQVGAQHAFSAMHMTTGLIAGAVVGIVLMFLVGLVCGGLAVAANTRAVGWLYLGEPASISAAYSAVLPKTRRYVWLLTIIYFVAWFPCVLIYAGYAVLMLHYVRASGMLDPHAGRPLDPNTALMLGGATVLFLLLVVVFGIYGILMSLRYSLAVPACTVEDLKARAAIKRSVLLSKGSRGRIFMLGLLTIIIQIGLAGLTQGFFIVAGIKSKGMLPLWMSVLQQLLAFVTNTFVGPIYATGFTLFYFDQRIRKEGFDIEHMMTAAGMTPALASVEAQAPLDPMRAEAGSANE
ncbi:hypothetical protein [Occallatibacter savannae]|uniref:hypothetical protein n=1 Tax=Occallatibacter savannae TaxID=1002691 RepID=UPI000D6931E5|nr:hypothetical protein [Occallatibacter savannae]